jgi:hypothetical protein
MSWRKPANNSLLYDSRMNQKMMQGAVEKEGMISQNLGTFPLKPEEPNCSKFSCCAGRSLAQQLNLEIF